MFLIFLKFVWTENKYVRTFAKKTVTQNKKYPYAKAFLLYPTEGNSRPLPWSFAKKFNQERQLLLGDKSDD